MSQPLTIIDQGSGRIKLEGDLTFIAIDKKVSHSFAFLKGAKRVAIDLGSITAADSAGLALLIEWIKYARHERIQLSLNNIPSQILGLAKLSGLDKSDYFAPNQTSQATIS